MLAFLSPWIVGFTVFFGYPLVMIGYLSFTHYDLLSPPRWIGLANYRYLLGEDPEVWPAVRNTLWIIAVAVPLQVLFAFGIAVMLTRARRGVGAFRTVFYLPALVPPVAATLGFVYLLNPATGPVNLILGKLGVEGPLWFNDPGWAKPSLVMLGLWGIGNTMVIFLAAVLDVPKHLYESADLDGAGPYQRMRWVTLPLISPVLLFAVILGVIQGLQYFTQAYVAASVAAGQASQAGGHEHPGARVSRRVDALLSDPPLLPRVPVLPHGLRVGDGCAAARRRVRAHTRDHPRLQPLRALPGGGTVSTADLPVEAVPAARRRPPRAVRRRRLLVSIADHSLLIAAAVIFAAPVVFIGLTSLMTNDQALSSRLWPEPFRWENYVDVFSSAPLWRWALNSFIYATLATLGLLLSSVPVAYAFARLKWRGRDAMFLIVLVALILPPQITVVPLYVMWAKLHLVGTLWPLIIPNWFGDAFAIFLLRQFFLTIPEEYLDAARVDGCGEFRILTTVVLRLAKPAIAAVALFSVLYTWNDFFLPLLYTSENPDSWVTSIGLSQFRNLHQVQWNLTMAATLLVMLPVVLVFFLAQKAFVEGVTLTGVKG